MRRPRWGRRPLQSDETKTFREGDKVAWNTHGTTTTGTVEKKITEAAGRTVRASQDEPQYLVRSDKGGGEAVHKPESLRKVD